jgi:hypothetical protein
MRLINFSGLNCYTNSAVSIADSFGADYMPAFWNLWTETDFSYDPFRKAYTSKRLMENLSALSLRLEELPCGSAEELEASFSSDPGGLFLVGMDAFHIPWSPRYRLFFGSHYFIAERAADCFLCHDPTYGKYSERMTGEYLLEHANAVSRAVKAEATGLDPDDTSENNSIAKVIPDMQSRLVRWVESCTVSVAAEPELERAAQYVDCLINNRLLYLRYISSRAPGQRLVKSFDDKFFSGWNAVKNGLYKASMIHNRAPVIGEVADKMCELLKMELSAARSF